MGYAVIIKSSDHARWRDGGFREGEIGEGGCEGIILRLSLTYVRNLQVHSATCSCIIEQYDNKRVVLHFRGFVPPYSYFLYFINFARRISEAAMTGREARSAPFCVLKSLKRPVCAVHRHARAAKTRSFWIGVYQIYEELTQKSDILFIKTLNNSVICG